MVDETITMVPGFSFAASPLSPNRMLFTWAAFTTSSNTASSWSAKPSAEDCASRAPAWRSVSSAAGLRSTPQVFSPARIQDVAAPIPMEPNPITQTFESGTVGLRC